MNVADCKDGTPGSGSSPGQDERIILALLNTVSNNHLITQRSLAKELGVALGLANSYLRRCVKKGLVKISKAPARRYAYYLTPQGFAEKSLLTVEYLRSSLGFYRTARNQCSDLLRQCAADGFARVALYGAGDLSEIAILAARDHPVTIVGVADRRHPDTGVLGVSVHGDIAELPACDAVLMLDMETPQESYDELKTQLPEGRLFVPALLHVTTGGIPQP